MDATSNTTTKSVTFHVLGLDELILQNMQKALTGEWQCLQCSFTSLRRDLVKGHVEAKHIDSGGFGGPLGCFVNYTLQKKKMQYQYAPLTGVYKPDMKEFFS